MSKQVKNTEAVLTFFDQQKGHFFWTSMNSISEIKREPKAEEGANIINLNPAQMQIGQPKLSLNCL